MAGENCLLSIKDYGTRRVVVTRVTHGMSVFTFNNDESQSRHRKQFLTFKRTSGSFDLSLIFTSSQARDRLSEWFRTYLIQASDPNGVTHPVRVTIPSRQFDKTGILEGELEYGDIVGTPTYKLELKFMGSRDPLDLTNDQLRSRFVPPESADPILPRLYPSGSVLNDAAQRIESNPFDTAVDVRGLLGGAQWNPRVE